MPADRDGCRIRVGDVVRVIGVPDLSGMASAMRDESLPIFEHILGTERRVASFNEVGWVELAIRILRGPHEGLHSVWLEPDLLTRCEGAPQ